VSGYCYPGGGLSQPILGSDGRFEERPDTCSDRGYHWGEHVCRPLTYTTTTPAPSVCVCHTTAMDAATCTAAASYSSSEVQFGDF